MRHKIPTVSAAVLLTVIWATDRARAATPATNPKVSVLWKFLGNASSSPNSYTLNNGFHYGTTLYGGPSDSGTIFQLKPAASGGWTQTVLYNFKGGADGVGPLGMVFDEAGNLYGATGEGGNHNHGTVFRLSPPAKAGATWKHTVLYAFTDGSDGAVPNSVTLHNGALFGTTFAGGMKGTHCEPGCGVVFELSPPTVSGGAWTETVLYSFPLTSKNGGGGNVVFDGNGALYSTTFDTVFQLAPPAIAGGSWTPTTLYTFGGAPDGAYPRKLAWGPDGALYGTTLEGGVKDCSQAGVGCGTIFRLSPPAVPGGAWTESVLYRFTNGSDGATPDSAPVFDANGALYGTALSGGSGSCNFQGATGCGTVFQLSPPAVAGNPWTFATLDEFTGGADGYAPDGVAIDNQGALYVNTTNGCTLDGPPSADFGDNGAIVQIAPGTAGGSWTASVLYSFSAASGGANPTPGLVADNQGNLYGIASFGGSGACVASSGAEIGCGVVFEFTPPGKAGGPWTESILFNFPSPIQSPSGSYTAPFAALVLDTSGTLYGTTPGVTDFGSVFELTPPAAPGGSWTETTLHRFAGGTDGANPGLVIEGNGVLYCALSSGGANGNGAVAELMPPAAPGGAWTNRIIHSFGANDRFPNSLVLQNGILYGSTQGPTEGHQHPFLGTVFQLTPPAVAGGAWKETVLHEFAGGTDGENPNGIVMGSDGSIYGATQIGGTGSNGIVFQLTPPAAPGGAWTENILYSFDFKGSQGGHPNNLVFVGANLVGSAAEQPDNTLLFQLTPPAAAGGVWSYSVLHEFKGTSWWGLQTAPPVNGKLIGTLAMGGNGTLNWPGTGPDGYGTLVQVTF